MIRNALAAQLAATGVQPPERASADYAVVAARASIAARKLPFANDFIALGIKFNPANHELAYLSRLIERETALAGKSVGP